MLQRRQIAVCVTLAGVFWLLATLAIRWFPAAVAPGLRGDLGFLASLPAGWLCVWLVCRLAKLANHQILAGAMVVLATAMLLDGVALR